MIIAFMHWGLCNRLKCLVSAMRVAEKTKRRLLICWPVNRHIGARFSDLFENNFSEINIEELEKIKSEKDYIKIRNENIIKKHLEKEIIIIESASFILFEEEIEEGFAKEFPNEKSNNIDHEFDRIPIRLRKDILKYVKRIKPKKNILKVVVEFSNKNEIKNCYGIHIRRGDFSSMLDGRYKVSRDELFIKEIKEILEKEPKVRFFLSTDGKKTELKLKKLFGNRIVTFPKKGGGKRGILEAQEALIDLLVLSKTKSLLLNYGTSFSEFSWWLGGCKAKVKVIGLEHEKARVREKIKKQKRVSPFLLKVRKKINAVIRYLKGKLI